jgi:hypothetical protein
VTADVSVNPTHDICQVCWALVPRVLMHFHRAWHDNFEGRPFHDTSAAPKEGSLEDLLGVIAQMKAMTKTRPRREFVVDLKERLMAEMLESMIDEQDSASSAKVSGPPPTDAS